MFAQICSFSNVFSYAYSIYIFKAMSKYIITFGVTHFIISKYCLKSGQYTSELLQPYLEASQRHASQLGVRKLDARRLDHGLEDERLAALVARASRRRLERRVRRVVQARAGAVVGRVGRANRAT